MLGSRWLSGKESSCQCRRHKSCRFDPWVRKIPWRRKWQAPPVFLPGESHGQRNLRGYSPWSCKELQKKSGMTAQLSTSMTLSANTVSPFWSVFPTTLTLLSDNEVLKTFSFPVCRRRIKYYHQLDLLFRMILRKCIHIPAYTFTHFYSLTYRSCF